MRTEPPVGVVERTRRFIATHPVGVGLALLLLACATRLALILTARWTGDEITEWQTGMDIATGKSFPLLGPVISGGAARNPGPLIFYVAAVPMLLTHAPEAANAFVALLGGVTVVVFWHALRAHFGEIGALLAGLLLACSPWSTLYADRIWNPNVVGLFVAVAFAAACRLRRRPDLLGVLTLFVAMAAMVQLHLSSPVVCLGLLPIWLPSVRRWRWHWPLIALAAASLLYVPMLMHELRTGWSNTLAFLHETSTNTSTDYRRMPLWAFRLMTLDISYLQLHGYWGGGGTGCVAMGGDCHPLTEGEMFSFLAHGNDDFRYGPVRWLLLGLSVVLAALALVVAGVRAFSGASRREPHPFFWAAVIAVTANVALLGLSHKQLEGHYVQDLIYFAFVAFAALGEWAATTQAPRAPAFVFALALLVCVGGIDAAIWESSTLDARNGLGTARRVIAAIERDQPASARAGITVRYRSLSADRLNLLTALDAAHPFQFWGGDQYQLLVSYQTPPRGARPILVTGPVTLYRTR